VSARAADTIYALSSGSPPAAIAVVRVSGRRADDVVAALAGRLPAPRRATVATLKDADGALLDRALVLRFPGPRSATGEDLAELHLHGGRAVVSAVLKAVAAVPGVRAAEPGEFTRRAYENGRIDLAEAEGLADLLSAETESQRRSALAAAGGALSRQVRAWEERLLALSAALEAMLDFSDEGEVGEAWPEGWREDAGALAAEMGAQLARPGVERLRDGVRVVIAGPPNAGKSSLLNCLARREAAIVAPVPGTTRDAIELPLAIAGTPFLLTDTAGIREAEDAVEREGVQRARQRLETADIVLWLGPAEERPEGAILVASKSDLGESAGDADVRVSAVTGVGIEKLMGLLLTRASEMLPAEGEAALNERQRGAVAGACSFLAEAVGADDPLLAAESLRLARQRLDEVTGRSGVENMLDALFGRFCVGK
jgi:tRNA modification GTPase